MSTAPEPSAEHTHRFRHLETLTGQRPEGEKIVTGGKTDIFYCETCLEYRRVVRDEAREVTLPMTWMQDKS